MSEPYLFTGVVLPQRAQISMQFDLRFTHAATGYEGEAKVSVVLNQVAVWVTSDQPWDHFDLRNVVKTFVKAGLDMAGFLLGHAYDLEITRVLNRSKNLDWVFGINVPCVSAHLDAEQLQSRLSSLRRKVHGVRGMFLTRCFSDLASAIKDADDTAFFCYRAIESLSNHSATQVPNTVVTDSQRWEIFRSRTGCTKESILKIKKAADPLRHGNPIEPASIDRAELFEMTWAIVNAYLEQLPEPSGHGLPEPQTEQQSVN